MSFFKEAVRDLFAKAQDVLVRSERAWLAAREAWNEDTDAQTQHERTILTDSQETPESAGGRKGRKKKNKAEKAAKGMGKKMRVGSSADIFIKPPEKALERAFVADCMSNDASRLILWTDASGQCSPHHTSGPAGIAVAFRHESNWVRITARLNQFNNIVIGETQAIVYALDYAVQQSAQLGVDLRQVEIFTDSQSALMNLIRTTPPKLKRKTREGALEVNKALLESAKRAIDALDAAGIGLEFHWVPRGKARGNRVADEGSRLARLAMEDLISPDHVMIEVIPTLDDKRILQVPVEETLASARATSARRECMAQEVAMVLTSQAESSPIKPLSGNAASIESPAATQSPIPDVALYPVDLLMSENQPMLEVEDAAESEPEPEPEREPEQQATSRVGLNTSRPEEAAFVRDDVSVPDRWDAPETPHCDRDRAEGWPDVRDASRS
ncbi:hypothetical protein CEP52_013548 [Fusarium oligoseptatum]|uniref:RNase H type-1 domain-containing protein n=1 Tax=Fusarium oligoseptatum TaxID=2604345 RepID=A0A428ST04_9HYPO|nr:hypothetical protein CEP52_013548 [Fusarium oligoseptatum]